MLKKTIKYEDFEGEEREETFYFNLSRAEIAEMELMGNGKSSLSKFIQKIVDEKNAAEITKLFKKIILMSVGLKSADGRRFEKSEQISKEFSETGAYSVLFTDLITDATAAAEFINGIVPQDMSQKN